MEHLKHNDGGPFPFRGQKPAENLLLDRNSVSPRHTHRSRLSRIQLDSKNFEELSETSQKSKRIKPTFFFPFQPSLTLCQSVLPLA